jgi:hypothetical protein
MARTVMLESETHQAKQVDVSDRKDKVDVAAAVALETQPPSETQPAIQPQEQSQNQVQPQQPGQQPPQQSQLPSQLQPPAVTGAQPPQQSGQQPPQPQKLPSQPPAVPQTQTKKQGTKKKHDRFVEVHSSLK